MEAKPAKKLRKSSLRGFAYVFMLAASGYFLWSAFMDVETFFSLKSSLHTNSVLLEEVNLQKEEMTTTKNNLTNPDYIEYLARGKYLVTKEGEQIFKFPAINKNTQESTEN